MPNMRAIRARIKSIESTRQITGSMKMVSTSKLRRTQTAMNRLGPYACKCGEMLSRIAAGSENVYLKPRNISKTCYVLFVGNRGLCGMYNTALLRHAEHLERVCENECFAVICGRWGADQIKQSGIPVVRTFTEIPDTPSSKDVSELTEYLCGLYESGEADEIVLVFQRFVSVLSQKPGQLRLLPVSAVASESGTDCIFEPDRESILEELTRCYLVSTIFSALLEAKSGEHAARLTAMTTATDNTDELITSLNLQLNHARQAAITTEISEIIGGAGALGK